MKIVVPVRVSGDDRAQFDRRGEPVSLGVPFPRGAVASGESWSLIKDGGKSLPVQTTILDRWGDGSVRWMLADFQADVSAGHTSNYSLVNLPFPASTPLTLTHSPAGLAVNTGAAQFVLPQTGGVAIARVEVDDRIALTDLTVTADDSEGRHYRLEIRQSSVLRSGPLTAIVRHDGDLVAADGTAWLASTVTLQFHAGLGAVRVEVSCTNPRAAVHPDGIWDLGDPGSVLIRDLSVTMRPPQGAGRVTASLDRHQPMSSAGDRFEVYQDSSGGANWQSVNHVNRLGQVPTAFRGFRAQVDGSEASGLRATPVASLHSGDSRLTIAMPHFWELFPKALKVAEGVCEVGVLPRQFSDSHELQGGETTTFAFMLAAGDDPVSAEPLAWARSPLTVTIDPDVYRRAGLWAPIAIGSPATREQYDALVHSVIAGDSPFSERREVIDEFGWRHFGEIYADHESISHPGLVSHYNNQYDAIAGMASRFMQTGDTRWSAAMRELAAHVTDIDLYRTTHDRAAYNGGYFWHTQHHVAAGTGTHRSYSRLSVSSGGGPSAEHNYTTGLTLHHFMTGCLRSRAAVLQLADWVLDMDDGRKSRFHWIDRGDTGLASGTRSTDFHGPGRGAGNSINALLDAHRLSGEARYLEKADALVARCVHPDDDQDAMQLLDAENRWSYTVFLQVLSKYLDYRADRGLIDARYSFAREVLLRYAVWMSRSERPYLERPEGLEHPTETWAAQDIRKAAVFEAAARHAAEETDRAMFLERATFFFDYSVNSLRDAPTGRLARPLVLMMTYGFQRPLTPFPVEPLALPPVVKGPRRVFIPLRRRVLRKAKLTAALVSAAALLAIGWLIL